METSFVANDITFLIKSFLRKDCVVNLIKSIRKYYPTTKIIVVDDTEPPLNFDEYHNVKTYNIQFNSGISVGRNFGVSQIKTKYFVLLDDDFEFTEDTKIQNFYDIIEKYDLDILGGQLIEKKSPVQYFGNFLIDKQSKTVIAELGYENVGEYKKCQIVLNFFIAKTESIKKHGWDDRMKTIEHSAFFYAHRDVLKIGFIDNVSIFHKRVDIPEYKPYRTGGWGGFLKWLEREDIKNYVNFSNQLTVSSDSSQPISKLNHTLALKNLVDLDFIFRKNKAPYWLQDGTLLGYFREGSFISHDLDTDLGMMYNDFSTKILDFAKSYRFEYTFVGYPEDCLQLTFKRFNIRTDVFFYYNKEDFMYHSAFTKNKRIDYRYKSFALKEIKFLDKIFFAPANELTFITTKYGENWKVPDTSWNFAYSPKNHCDTGIIINGADQTEKIKKLPATSKPKTVITYGTFDTLHYGHLELLRRARQFGDKLVVGLSTDRFNEIKGKQTKFSYAQRYEWLKSTSFVDEIIPETDWGQKQHDIKKYSIDVMIMGDDWVGKFDDLPCTVIYLTRTPEISSTKIKSITS